MPIEQRVIGAPKIGAKNPAPGGKIGERKPAVAEEAPAKKKPKKLLVIVAAAAVLVLGGGAAWYFVLGPGSGGDAHAAAEEEPAPEPGEVLAVEPISINLADGHYLRISLGLQLTAEVGEESPDPSKAVDHVIALFSGRPMAEVSDPTTREQLKAQLLAELTEAYEGEVMDVYLTNYVTQ